MSFEKEITNHFSKGHEIYLRHISVDCVIFGFHENELKVLLLETKYAGHWALPGGFILKEEDMDDSAIRILKNRTGLNDIYLQQFHVFGEPKRSTKEINKQFLKNVGVEMNESWMFERFITIGYTALVDFSKVQPIAPAQMVSGALAADDLRHLIYRLMLKFKSMGVTTLLTLESNELVGKSHETQQSLSPLADNLLLLRYAVDEAGALLPTLTVIKTRGSDHGRGSFRIEFGAGGMRLEAPVAAGQAT